MATPLLSDFQEVDLEESTTSTRNAEVHVALVGEIASGKSSFVNAIRGLEDGDGHAAETDTNTNRPEGYFMSDHKKVIKLWDLPGLNTFDKKCGNAKSHCGRFDMKKYDAVLVFIKGRFTKTGKDLVQEIILLKKPFFLVRTNIDRDLDRKKRKRAFDEAECLKEIREDIVVNLDNNSKVFLISNDLPSKWEFDSLRKAISTEFKAYQLRTSTLQKVTSAEPAKQVNKQNSPNSNAADREDWSRIFERNLRDTEIESRNQGIAVIVKKMEKCIDDAEHACIKLAVIGRSGQGKSSFINALTGAQQGDVNYAATGYNETTTEPKGYEHPSNERYNIVLWDLPGFGTTTMDDFETYCSKIKIRTYDAFIIMSMGSFLDDDLKIVKKIKSLKIPYFFVRSHIDVAYSNESKKSGPFNENKMLDEMREDIRTNCKCEEEDIFLINNNNILDWDFPNLMEAILKRLPSKLQTAFNLAIFVTSEKILKSKVRVLKGRKFLVSFISVFKKMNTVEKSRSYDFNTIRATVEKYRKTLGLLEKSQEFKWLSSASDNKNKELLKKAAKFNITDLSEVKLEEWLRQFTDESEKPIPGLDDTRRRPLRFVYRALDRVLDEMSDISMEILNEAKKFAKSKTGRNSEQSS